jgi:CHAT domain-containing protein/tetratricopeptide (TPR) repeat protein
MDDDTLAGLAHHLAEDEEAGFQWFRHLFFQALERRRLEECQPLVNLLQQLPSPFLQRESRYHQAIIDSERRQFDRAEALLRGLLEEELTPIQQARVLLVLGIQLNETGQWPEAEQIFRRALVAYAAINDLIGQAKAYNDIGIAITFPVEQGAAPWERLQDAVDAHEAALGLLAQVTDENVQEEVEWERARNWHGKGVAYGLIGEHMKALNALHNHISLCEQLDDPGDRAIGLSDLAALALEPLGELAAAAATLDEAIALLREHEDPLHLAEALTRRGNLRVAQEQFPAAQEDYTEALDLVESIRARLAAPTTQANYRTTVEFIYTAPLSLYLRQGEAASAFTVAERARSRVLADLLASQLAEEHTPADLDCQVELLDPNQATLTNMAPLTAEEVCQRLPANTALLTYVGDDEERLWSLLVTANGVQAQVVPKVAVPWLHTYLAQHLDGSRRGRLVPDPQTGHLHPLRLYPELYQVLLEPIWPQVAEIITLYVVPYGPLYYLPLGALTPELASPPPLLAAGRRVVYAPSATVLLNYCHRRAASSQQGTLVVAPRDPQLQLIQGAAQRVAPRSEDLTLVGPAATRQALLAQAGAYRRICFLGHALFDRRYPMMSSLLLADGSLHANDLVQDLHLDAELVVLAACESGRGQVLRGDEILGLSRALLYAGTPSLLVTLWPVHEIPTRLLVEQFFGKLPASDPALALAESQQWLRSLTYENAQALLTDWQEIPRGEIKFHLMALWQMTHPGETLQANSMLFAHPFFWSPYILIGDQPSREEATRA